MIKGFPLLALSRFSTDETFAFKDLLYGLIQHEKVLETREANQSLEIMVFIY
jgi:hypothetical protein